MPEDAVECQLSLTQYFEDNLQLHNKKMNQSFQGCSYKTFLYETHAPIVQYICIGVSFLNMTFPSCPLKKEHFETIQILPVFAQ